MSLTNAVSNIVAKSTNFESGLDQTLNGIGNAANTVSQMTKVIKSLMADEYKSPALIRDVNTNGFLATHSIFEPQFFARAFDEPTYLSFRIEFITDPNDPSNKERNISYNNMNVLSSAYETAMYSKMYDYMPEPFLDSYVVTSSDASLGKRYSAEAYLDQNLGDHARASMLHTFKLALNDLQKVFPFYFKSISGLSSLTKVDPKTGMRVKEGSIEIDCEEGLDLKITQLLSLYRKIVWDDTYQRWVLPDMMRYFGMRIYISEIRLFHDMKTVGKKADNLAYDFSMANVRNATQTPSKDSVWDKINNIGNKVNALSSTFLGTKSILNEAIGYTSQAMTAANDIVGAVKSISQDIIRCNNAINNVMPTICLECHMCEFDIQETLKHIDQLQSSTKGNNPLSPKIKIKIGQVKESHSYPLNASLKYGKISEWVNGGSTLRTRNDYYKTIKEHKDGNNVEHELSGINSFLTLVKLRDENLRFLGNYIYDEALNKKYSSPNLNDRIIGYIEALEHISGDTEALTLSEKRFVADYIVNNINALNYNKDSMTQEMAQATLTTAALNEAVDLTRKFGSENNIVSDIVGTDSLATHQHDTIIKGVKSIGDALNEAIERIYTDPAITSMALSDEMKTRIANNTLQSFVQELESTATANGALKSILTQFRALYDEKPINLSTATSKSKIEAFSGLN